MRGRAASKACPAVGDVNRGGCVLMAICGTARAPAAKCIALPVMYADGCAQAAVAAFFKLWISSCEQHGTPE